MVWVGIREGILILEDLLAEKMKKGSELGYGIYNGMAMKKG